MLEPAGWEALWMVEIENETHMQRGLGQKYIYYLNTDDHMQRAWVGCLRDLELRGVPPGAEPVAV